MADFTSLRVTANVGHLAIQKNVSIGTVFPSLDRFRAVVHRVNLVAQLAEVQHGDQLVDRIVLREENAKAVGSGGGVCRRGAGGGGRPRGGGAGGGGGGCVGAWVWGVAQDGAVTR